MGFLQKTVFSISDMDTPAATTVLLSRDGEMPFINHCLGLDYVPRNMRRRVGPPRATHFGLRAEVKWTESGTLG